MSRTRCRDRTRTRSRGRSFQKAATIFCKRPLTLILAFHDEEGRQKVTLEMSLRSILRAWQESRYHLPLPQLLSPDMAFPPSIYGPTSWTNPDRYQGPSGNGEVPSWLVAAANQLAPPIETLPHEDSIDDDNK